MNSINKKDLERALNALSIDNAMNTPDFTLVEKIFAKVSELTQQTRGQPPQTREYPPYPVMIRNLFKTMPEVPYASALHAAVGIAGESAEWIGADNFTNILEEAGDMEFYVEALKQNVASDIDGAVKKGIVDIRATNLTIGTVFVNVVTLGGDILDQVKKSWVYGKPLNSAELTRLVLILELNLEAIYKLFDVSRAQVQLRNQVKLIGPGGRFESGFYSDSAAIKRADKQPGEDRSFFGKAAIVEKDGLEKSWVDEAVKQNQ